MTVEFQLNKEEYVEFMLFHIKKTKYSRYLVYRSGITYSLGMLLILLILFGLAGIPTLFTVIGAVLNFTLYIIFYPKYFYHKIRTKYYKYYDKNPDIHCFWEVTISNGILYSKSDFSETKWLSIKSIEETENLILIYIDPESAIVIPKRTFTSVEEKERFIMSFSFDSIERDNN
jgi:hypothetical protein